MGLLWTFCALAAAINPSPALWVFITEHAWLQGTQTVSVLNPVVGYTFYFLAFVTWCVLVFKPGRRRVLRLAGLGVAWAMWWILRRISGEELYCILNAATSRLPSTTWQGW